MRSIESEVVIAYAEYAVEQTNELTVIWDVMPLTWSTETYFDSFIFLQSHVENGQLFLPSVRLASLCL